MQEHDKEPYEQSDQGVGQNGVVSAVEELLVDKGKGGVSHSGADRADAYILSESHEDKEHRQREHAGERVDSQQGSSGDEDAFSAVEAVENGEAVTEVDEKPGDIADEVRVIEEGHSEELMDDDTADDHAEDAFEQVAGEGSDSGAFTEDTVNVSEPGVFASELSYVLAFEHLTHDYRRIKAAQAVGKDYCEYDS